MNASDDVESHTEEALECGSMDTASSNNHNDCSKQTNSGTPTTNSVSGSSPLLVQELVCNIPNGNHQSSLSSPKLTNISSAQSSSLDCEKPSTSGLPFKDLTVNGCKLLNGSSGDELHIDVDMRNNVDCHTVEKFTPPKVPCSTYEVDNLPTESDLIHISSGCIPTCSRKVSENVDSGSSESWVGSDGRPRFSNFKCQFRPPIDSDSSSDTGNDDALSGEECIYTYKGDQAADLANSLFGLAFPPASEAPAPPVPHQDGASSPEMDFLEMDFDPDPSGEQDSADGESDEGDLLNRPDSQIATPPPEQEEARNDLSATNSHSQNPDMALSSQAVGESSIQSSALQQANHEPHVVSQSSDVQAGASSSSQLSPIPATTSSTQFRSAGTCWPARDTCGHHSSGGDLCSPGDNSDADGDSWADTLSLWNMGNLQIQGEALLDSRKFNLHSALYHCIMAKRLVLDKQSDFEDENDTGTASVKTSGDGQQPLQRTMIWTEQEACSKQVSQIAVSSCGATAVINVLLSLNIPLSVDHVKEGVATRLRADTASIPDYLFSRSVAGAAHRDLIRGLEFASGGRILSRFFHFYPERAVSLSRWLAHWIKKGAVPVATLNLQNGVAPGNEIPDSWHHQMIFGVSQRGIYFTNPLECISEAALWPQLCSPSVLLVRRNDIVSRWTPTTDLSKLATNLDIRWKKMNVLGQVVNVLRESNFQVKPTQGINRTLTPHVLVPASYCSGILLAVLKNSPTALEVQEAPELPLLKD